jgi:predicted DNA-binding antitoxin AbrB/MazE fold protein
MSIQVDAIYENGVFRPLHPVHLPEHQRVTFAIEEESAASETEATPLHFTLPADRWQAFCDALDSPPKELPRLKKLLSAPSLFDGNGTGVS